MDVDVGSSNTTQVDSSIHWRECWVGSKRRILNNQYYSFSEPKKFPLRSIDMSEMQCTSSFSERMYSRMFSLVFLASRVQTVEIEWKMLLLQHFT